MIFIELVGWFWVGEWVELLGVVVSFVHMWVSKGFLKKGDATWIDAAYT